MVLESNMHILVTSCLGTQPPFCPSSPLPFIPFSIFSLCLVWIFVLFNRVTNVLAVALFCVRKMQDSSPCAVGHSSCHSDSFTWESHRMCVATSPLEKDAFSGGEDVMRRKCFPVVCRKATREWKGPDDSFLGECPLWTQGDRTKDSWNSEPSRTPLSWLRLGSS